MILQSLRNLYPPHRLCYPSCLIQALRVYGLVCGEGPDSAELQMFVKHYWQDQPRDGRLEWDD